MLYTRIARANFLQDVDLSSTHIRIYYSGYVQSGKSIPTDRHCFIYSGDVNPNVVPKNL